MQIDIKESETGCLIPFSLKELKENGIKRFFIIKNKEERVIRGNHAHKRDSQKLILLSGRAEILFENSEQKSKIELQFGIPYLSKPYEWLTINMIEKDTIILVLCTEEYNEDEYIREYKIFKEEL
jgi:dTDP-4-dehydrorhamnose 3,5-epimerase-like enzyme